MKPLFYLPFAFNSQLLKPEAARAAENGSNRDSSEAARNGRQFLFVFSCPGGAGSLLTTVVHSDIRGLGTGLPYSRRGAASRFVLEFGQVAYP